jgi:hypothetical protein
MGQHNERNICRFLLRGNLEKLIDFFAHHLLPGATALMLYRKGHVDKKLFLKKPQLSTDLIPTGGKTGLVKISHLNKN